MTLADRTIGEFLENVASNEVTPSGGAVAGISGAMGAALCEMVCIHTLGTEEHADVADEMTDCRDTLAASRRRLLELADDDVRAVDRVQTAFESGDSDRIQKAAKRSTMVPIETAEICLDVVDAAVTVTAKGTQVAVPDAVVGALLAHAALEGSVSTVHANLATIEDPEFVTEMERRAAEMEVAAEEALSQVRANRNW
ncbi:cyclodeaminase/cyclohydrolase family protein [Halomicroarcula sp. F13]|uniref:Cyclodeaminase/cyclohydrolase family protein n=1 Tax=Haloarcula rubra TaxID=2487747 RepID=A0AAW4PW25_9EURY|nr:cyclodeaminase/cyclohydrolase family protein [Halomicroarcula rubra]MBX0324462.1 cyclodeaminase/cyclohydrolase family protein [Halomicroarcula rubra]